MDGSFSKSVIFEEMMHITYCSVRSLACIIGFANQAHVDNLLRDCLAHTCNTKDGTFTVLSVLKCTVLGPVASDYSDNELVVQRRMSSALWCQVTMVCDAHQCLHCSVLLQNCI